VVYVVVFKLFVHTYKNVELYSSLPMYITRAERKGMSAQLRKRERDRVAIVAEILEMARDGVLKSRIMWRARLSYSMLNGYLGLMTSNKLLDRVLMNKRLVFKTTDKGLKFLYLCRQITELLDVEDNGNKLYERIQLLSSSPF
jgi:predicted transcriptional regulator